MPIHHQARRLIASQPQWSWGIASVLILVIVIIGVKIIFFSHAGSTSTWISAEAESGNRTTGATLASDTNASGGSYVLFGATPTPAPTPTPTPTPVGNSMCGFKTGTPAINKVMIIWEENESSSSIVGNGSLPYFNSIVNNCGLATNYFAYTHPSLPNYMAMTSGVSYASGPWNNDCNPTDSGCNTGNASIFSQMGSGWKSYAESMGTNSTCNQSPSGRADSGATDNSSNIYAPRHNPATYYTNISSACSSQDVNIPTTDTPSSGTITNSAPVTASGALSSDISSGLARFTTVTPNLMNDWHDGSAGQVNTWLNAWIPVITAGPDYQSGNLAILIVWDEGAGTGNSASQTTAVWMSPYTVPGTKAGTRFDQYSVLKTIEDLMGVQELGSAASATSMASAFNL